MNQRYVQNAKILIGMFQGGDEMKKLNIFGRIKDFFLFSFTCWILFLIILLGTATFVDLMNEKDEMFYTLWGASIGVGFYILFAIFGERKEIHKDKKILLSYIWYFAKLYISLFIRYYHRRLS